MRFHEVEPREKINIRGSYGKLVAYKDTGVVIPKESDFMDGDEGDFSSHTYRDIVMIDVLELKETYYSFSLLNEFDILDVGYWTNTGKYEPPCHVWREEYRNAVSYARALEQN